MKEGANIPYRFREARLQAGLTTVQLAQKMGVTQAAVSHWDAGKKVPGTETLYKLADLYGVTIDYLLGRSSDTGIAYTPSEIADASRPQKILCNRRNLTV